MNVPQHRIVMLEATGSTNKDALRLALAGEPLPIWVAAGRQSEGRGRAGRTWISQAGNLQASAALLCQAPLAKAGELALVAGIAVHDAVRGLSPVAAALPLRLKWPNDLLIGSAKAGGILVESTTARGAPGFLAVIGVGLNIASQPDDLGRAVTSLRAHGVETTAGDALVALADSMAHWLEAWRNGEAFTEAIVPAWLSRAGPDGEPIAVSTAQGQVQGRYRGIDMRGYLVLETADGTRQTISHGDVALSSAAEGSREE